MRFQKLDTLLLALLALLALLFSFWLMFHTFSYDVKKSSVLIATKAWSDFGSHIPLIRSFSMGDNFDRLAAGKAPEYPLFPGEPIRYHFGFYALVGLLERLGLRIDWALNVPSSLGFFFLIVMIWVLSKKLFRDTRVATLSVVFFLFNGSLSFVNFFQQHPLSWNTPLDIITNSRFPSFGPWDGGLVSAFWTLNIYTNQRHLALSFALALFCLWVFIQRRNTTKWNHARGELAGDAPEGPHVRIAFLFRNGAMEKEERNASTRGRERRGRTRTGYTDLSAGLLAGLCLGFLLFINQAAAAIVALFLVWFFLIDKEARRPLVIAGIATIPFIYLLTRLTTMPAGPVWQPGYLVRPPFTIISFVKFWIANLGLHVLFIPLGFILAPRPVKKLLIVPLIVLFLLPNLFRFSPDMINNHKFFNFFLILGNMFTAYALNKIFFQYYARGGVPFRSTVTALAKKIGWRESGPDLDDARQRHTDLSASIGKSRGGATWVLRMVALVGLVGLTFSGIIDIFPILNDTKRSVLDLPANPDAQFFATQTPADAVVANSTWFYHPASLAGRAIFNGYSYFTWSYGYDQNRREQAIQEVYRAGSLANACRLLLQHKIDYVELVPQPEEYLKPNWGFWNSLTPVYKNPKTNRRIFSRKTMCMQSIQ